VTVLAQEATATEARSLVLVLAAASLGTILAHLHRRVVLPTVVTEIALGILIGPEVLDLAQAGDHVQFLANLGLVMLFFFAGLELVEHRVPPRSLARGSGGWGISLALGLLAGLLLHAAGLDAESWLLAVALSTTALGTLVPILADSDLLPTSLGRAVLGSGVAGEFWPIVVISVFLTSAYGALVESLLLVAFGAVVVVAALAALRARPPQVVRVLQQTVHTTGQAAVRMSLLCVAALVFLAIEVDLDFILGAFAGGLVVGLALDSEEGHAVQTRLEGVGFGFLIPIYFVVTGMTFDVDSLVTPTGLALAALFLGLLLVVRGTSALLWLRLLGPRQTLSLGLFTATGLPLIVAIADIGTDRGAIADDVAASLIGAGMISVLVLPLLASTIVRRESSRVDDVRADVPA
jgi:Kef-type K+ transport system membrane component KefB